MCDSQRLFNRRCVEQVPATESRPCFFGFRERGNLLGMTNENFGEVIAGLEQGESRSGLLLVAQLRTGKRRGQKPVKILSGLLVQVLAARDFVERRRVNSQPLEHLLVGRGGCYRFERAEQLEFGVRRMLMAGQGPAVFNWTINNRTLNIRSIDIRSVNSGRLVW